jgi:hypothetical protein
MTCWNGHVPRMNNDQMHQAVHAYFAAYQSQVAQRLDESIFLQGQPPWTGGREPPEHSQSRRTTSLAEARPADRVGAIDVEYVRVRE